MSILTLPQPYLLFLGDAVDERDAKTAMGLRDWAGDRCVGEFALPTATITTGLPRLTPAAARARGAQSLVIGVAPAGGMVQPSWIPALLEALRAGLDLVSGMHTRLDDVPVLRGAALELGRRLIDVRKPRQTFPVGTGRRRSGKRLLTVGTDCALGKKYTALALARAFKQRDVAATFRATGQTGIMISGSGVAIDAVVADFIAGAAEALTPDAATDHWDVVEGQGSLFHPAYSGVSLGLLHGTQPDVIVMCHEAGREAVHGLTEFALPSLKEAIDVTLMLARRTNPGVRCGGVSLNTSTLPAEAADALLARHSAELALPCADPIRGGARFDELVSSCLRA
jgi:uncharacterized NAD-dependent epimerase/dehydratase family protein